MSSTAECVKLATITPSGALDHHLCAHTICSRVPQSNLPAIRKLDIVLNLKSGANYPIRTYW